jgi:predicted nucleic acid-binding Zn ribbon protein
MPIYKWKDKKSGVEVEVIREFASFEVPPSEEELPNDQDDRDFKEAVWERIISSAPKVIKGDGWGPGGKGYW